MLGSRGGCLAPLCTTLLLASMAHRQSPRRLYAALQVNPEGTNSGTFSACFQTNATSDNPIAVQSILPDLTNFKVKSLCSAMLN